MKTSKNITSHIEDFFSDYLIDQKQASGHTITLYSNTLKLLLEYVTLKLRKKPSRVSIDDLNAKFISQFLDDLEKERKISVRSRNARLAAIHSFFHYISSKLLENSRLINEVLAIPSKRSTYKLIAFLADHEVEALLAAPDRGSWIGKRDHMLLLLAVHTGFRLSELTGLKWSDVTFRAVAYVTCLGKGRKNRTIPLSKQASACLDNWGKEQNYAGILFPTTRGDKMSSDAVQYLIGKYAVMASKKCPSLSGKKVTPHMLRHTTAMRLLKAGVGLPGISIWLGHESVKTTYIYLSIDMEMKENILEKLKPMKTKSARYKVKDDIIKFLSELSNQKFYK